MHDGFFASVVSQGGDEKKQLSLLDDHTLEYQRYGEVFAEIILAGNIVMPGGSVRENPTPFCVFNAKNEEEVKVSKRVGLKDTETKEECW